MRHGFLYRVRVTSSEGSTIAYVPLEKFSIGSEPRLPLAIKHPHVERNHVTVSCVDGEIWLTDQQSNLGTYVEGRRIPSGIPFRYSPGARIRIADLDYSLQIHLFVQNDKVVSPRPSSQQEAQEKEKFQAGALQELRSEMEKVERQMLEKARSKADHAYQDRIQEELKQAGAQALQIRLAAQREAEKILEETRVRCEELQIKQRGAAEQEAETIRSEAMTFRQMAEKEMGDRLDEVNRRYMEVLEQARTEGASLVQKAQQQVEEMVTIARHKASVQEQNMLSATANRLKELESEFDQNRSAKFKELESQIQHQLAQTEAKCMTMQESARRGSQELIAKAELEAARIVEASRLRAAEEKSDEITRLHEQAQREADAILAKAHEQGQVEVQGILASLRKQLEEEIRDRQKEASHIVDRALHDASVLREKSRAEIDELFQVSRLEAQRQTDHLLAQARKECEVMREHQQEELAARRRALEEELITRRQKVEQELGETHKLEIERIEKFWALQAEMAENRRVHDIALISENIASSMSELIEGNDRKEVLVKVKDVVERSFPPLAWKQDQNFKQKMGNLLAFRSKKKAIKAPPKVSSLLLLIVVVGVPLLVSYYGLR